MLKVYTGVGKWFGQKEKVLGEGLEIEIRKRTNN